jgi:hypothetical protein
MNTAILVLLVLVVIAGVGVLTWWLLKKSKKTPTPVPTYSNVSKQMLEKYVSKTPANPSSNLNDEWKDALRLVSAQYNDDMLERCLDNESTGERIQSINCAFYKTAYDWNKDASSVELDKLLQLATLELIMRVDTLTPDTTPDRSKLVSYDKEKQLIKFESAPITKDLKQRLKYMIENNVDIPSAVSQMNQADSQPFILPVDAFYYTLIETLIKQVSSKEANCKLCNQN